MSGASQWQPPEPEAASVDVEVMPDLPVGKVDAYQHIKEQPDLWMKVFSIEEVWETSIDLALRIIMAFHDLFMDYGDPVHFGEDRHGFVVPKGINEGFFAAFCAARWLVLYEPDEKKFYCYNHATGIYESCTAAWLKKVVSGVLLKASTMSPTLERLAAMRTDRVLNAVVSQMRGVAEKRGAFENRERRIHLANCVLRLTSDGYIREEFSPDHYSRRRSPIAYDPDAKCPRFLNELLGPAMDPEDLLLLQKMAGQFLYGVNSIQRLLSIYGQGGRGKTTLTNILQGVVGEDLVGQLRTKQLGERFEVGRYAGCTMLIGPDVGDKFLCGESAEVVKSLIGGDRFVAERKNSNDNLPVRGDFNLLINSNAPLKVAVNDDASAWRRRLLIVEFGGGKPVKKLPNFDQLLLEEEGAGILNWMLDGLRMLRDDIEELGDIRLTPAQAARIDALVGYGESVREFVSTRLCLRAGSDLSVAELLDTYLKFCDEKGWSPMSEGRFQCQLPDLMAAMGASRRHDIFRNDHAVRGYAGVGFVDEAGRGFGSSTRIAPNRPPDASDASDAFCGH